MSDELKPCPHCGGEAMLIPADDESPAEVYCSCCWCSVIKSDTAGAIAAWNSRAAVTDEQFSLAVHDGRAWQVVRECEMREAHWDDGECVWGCRCSECGHRFTYETGSTWNYCPNCGAKVVV